MHSFPVSLGATTKKKLQVLVVDHNPQDRRVLESLCAYSTLKWEITFLESGKRASRYLFPKNEAKAPVPDLIIVETSLPDIDGWELLRRIRISHRLRGIPALVLTRTGEAELSRSDRATELDATVLPKPRSQLEFSSLIDRIEWIWRRHRDQQMASGFNGL